MGLIYVQEEGEQCNSIWGVKSSLGNNIRRMCTELAEMDHVREFVLIVTGCWSI